MLPSYLLANSLFSTELNRNQRIEQLSFGCSIVLIYYNDYINYNFEKGKQSRSRQGGTNQHMTLFDSIWLKKYISLTTSLVQVIREQKEVHLGSFGTHFLEHFFGMVRSFAEEMIAHHRLSKLLITSLFINCCKKKNLPISIFNQEDQIAVCDCVQIRSLSKKYL